MAERQVVVLSDYGLGDTTGPYRTIPASDILKLYNVAVSGTYYVATGSVVQQYETRYPKLWWSGVSSISVAASSSMESAVKIRFQDGLMRSFSGQLNWSFANGAADLGLDQGAEQVNTWYYMYAVPSAADNSVISLRASATSSFTGPFGYTNWRYFGAFRNNAAGNIKRFIQTSKDEFAYSSGADAWVYGGNAASECGNDGGWVLKDLSAFIPSGSTAVNWANYVALSGEAGGVSWNPEWSTDGTNWTLERTVVGDSAVGVSDTFNVWIPILPGLVIYKNYVRTAGVLNLSYTDYGPLGWKDGNL